MSGIKCEKCGQEFMSKLSLNDHMRDRHGRGLSSHELKEMKKRRKRKRVRDEQQSANRSSKMKMLAVAGIVIISVIAAGAVLSQSSQEAPEATTGQSIARFSGDPSLGDENAPVTIVAYEDFECPFCNRFTQAVKPRLEEEFIQTGKARFVYKDFPLSHAHPNAQKAAEAAQCAFDQGKFWEYHDVLFENAFAGNVFTRLGGSQATQLFKQYATDLSLDTERFNQCLDSGQKRSVVLSDLNEGQSAGVRGTPSFLVNGRLVVGAQPFHVWQSMISGIISGSDFQTSEGQTTQS